MKYYIHKIVMNVKLYALLGLGYTMCAVSGTIMKIIEFIDKKKEERIKKSRKVKWITAD